MKNCLFSFLYQLNIISIIPFVRLSIQDFVCSAIYDPCFFVSDNGFSVLFDIESYDYGYYDEGSEGLKVRIS